MEIRAESLDFSQPLRGSGPRTAQKTVVFPRNVVSAVAGLSGYLTEFSGNDDHHVGLLDVRLSTEINNNVVTVTGRFGLRDWSGSWDDNYDGSIDFVVLAELASATAPPPRGDLSITGVEFNQAIQYFRANRFLDSANVKPDNSVFLIEGKNTGVRVYVDYDASSGLPTITSLSGLLVVSGSFGSITIPPLNSGITPRRDATINQSVANHTLNFMIPAGFSAGTISVACTVFDQANPSQAGGVFTRTLVFTRVEPLNVFLVGVQTLNPAAPAPSQAAIAGAFTLLQKTYPRGLVQFTGFNTITLTPQIVGSMATSGCGSGWNTLLDQLKELKGGSSDVYFGGLPAGIFSSGVVGCSPVGDRVAAAFIDLIVTVPHEVGHSLGREHDPCRACSPAAQDPDNNYPQYNTFNSDSIGVFGFDPTTTPETVFSPASTFDFMTAFVQATNVTWISPYTHQGLLGPIQGGPSAGGGMTLVGGQHKMLFLGLEISRDRKVTRRVSFNHPAVIQGTSRCESGFTFEFQDPDRKVLDCGVLHCLCSSDCGCWPKTIRDVVPYPEGAAYFAVYEKDNAIYEEKIPEPPRVKIVGHKTVKDGIELRWSSSEDALAFLVHYRHTKAGAWRGVAPRLEGNSLLIPLRLFRERALAVRVLASSGIATGYDEIELRPENYQPPDVTIRMVGVGVTGDGPVAIDALPHVLVTDVAGAQVPDEHIHWYDSAGGSLGRGRQVDLRNLPEGRHVVRAVVRGHGGRTVGKSWAIERKAGAYVVHAVISDPKRAPRKPTHPHPHPAPPKYEE